MCEPTHSIVQYSHQDDEGRPTQPKIEREMEKRSGFRKVIDWGKKILDWIHFSAMGAGHSFSIQLIGAKEILLPADTRYEALWWDRTFRIDGRFHGEEFDAQLAFDCAHEYAKEVSLGNLTKLRMFLETSMHKTEYFSLYVSAFFDNLICRGGRDEAIAKLRNSLNIKKVNNLSMMFGVNPTKDVIGKAIKVMLGLTRKRHLLNSAWADDQSLWDSGFHPPGQGMVEGKPSLGLA